MALSIGKIRTLLTRPLQIEVEGEPLHFQYTPAGFTPELEELTRQAEGDNDKLGTPGARTMLKNLLMGWDLTEDAPDEVTDAKTGKKRAYDPQKDGPLPTLPIDDATLRIVPNSVLFMMLSAIVEDLNPNATSGENSNASSSTEAA
jgi:hypothetical protein